MNKDDKTEVLRLVAVLGFDSTFDGTFEFDNIRDADFHRARVIYLRARRQLAECIGYPEDLDLLERESLM